MPLYHVTYRDRNGVVQTQRVPASTRNGAITATVSRYNARRSDVTSVVRVER